MKAQFEIRRTELTVARKIFGQVIGMCLKDKLFKGYIDLERKLYEFVRCRKLYEKHIEWNPVNCQAWIKFAELERDLADLDRARAIFELTVYQFVLDMSELLWKVYIDFDEEEDEYDRTRELYERLLVNIDHVKVWIFYAHFEINVSEVDDDDEDENENENEDRFLFDAAKQRVRRVFIRAYSSMKLKNFKEERVALLNAWRSFEVTHDNAEDIENVEKQMPRKVKRRRKLYDDSFEEYMDYVFPTDDVQAAKLSSLLARAHEWKKSAGTGVG